MFYESIVLLGCTLRQRLKPVGIVCHAIIVSPLLHAFSHCIGYVTVETNAIVDDINHLVVNSTVKILIHLLTCENFLAKELRRTL